jgi:sugar lactone lactonase YvrE
LIIGPTGVGLGADGVLYVADTIGNRIAAIPNAPSGTASSAMAA